MPCDFSLITIPVSNCRLFSDINISQSSVATHLRYGGILSYHYTANLLLSQSVKEFCKSVTIWRSYRHEFGGLLFWNTVCNRCIAYYTQRFCSRFDARLRLQLPQRTDSSPCVLYIARSTRRQASADRTARRQFQATTLANQWAERRLVTQ